MGTAEALFLLPLAGGEALRLSAATPPEHYVYGYSFTPEGRWLIYDVRCFDFYD